MTQGAQVHWGRDTPWRQGHILPPDAVAALGLDTQYLADDVRMVVVTHDCDLANDNLDVEPEVELLAARVVAEASGNLTWGKNPRKLHLDVRRGAGDEVLELVQTKKVRVDKVLLAHYSPSMDYCMGPKSLATMRSWLASRYNRAAFANEFVDRLKLAKADERLARLLQPHGALISFVYFQVDGGHTVERHLGDPYIFDIVLVFAPGDDAEKSADAADELAQMVATDLQKRLKDPSLVILRSCIALGEDDVTVGQARLLTQWLLEYMTQRADEPQLGPPSL